MRSRRSRLPLVALVAAAVAAATWLAVAQAATPAITAVDPYSWQANGTSPATVAIMAGGEVKFSYPSGATHHYPVLHSGPGATPNCNTPTTLEAAAPGWSGSCTFSEAGTYVFYCGVHGALMTATVTVTANPGEPTASARAASGITETTATLEGTVNPEGHETFYHFRYGRTTGYESPPTETHTLPVGSTPETVSALLDGLAPATTYHYQLVAENSVGTVRSADQTFTTASPPGPPSATTGTAAPVSETGATLKGTVNPDGRPTEYFFEWGTSSAYGQLTAAVPAGEDHAGHPASAVLSSLSPATIYHFRLVARNTSSETKPGADQTFTTLSPPLPPSPPSPPLPPVATLPPTAAPLLTLPPSKDAEGVGFGAPLASASLKLTAPRHASTVRGSIEIGQTGAGGRLEVDLLAKSALLAKTRSSGSKSVRVGRLVHQSVSAGKVSFAVALTAQGKRALVHRRSLPLTVKITLTPSQGAAATVTRSVTLRS